VTAFGCAGMSCGLQGASRHETMAATA